jgi:inositol phosphorylceramide synthase catalytic subunit
MLLWFRIRRRIDAFLGQPCCSNFIVLWKIIPVLLWYFLFVLSPTVPAQYRPQVNVTTLPTLEAILFRGLPHQKVSALHNSVFDVVAATVYTLHAALPVFFCVYLVFKKRKDRLLDFVLVFGVTNFLGVLTHVLFPTAPPWWYDANGVNEASYNVHGDPAGLKRVDALIGSNVYENTYRKSPIVFGSFPSLHAAWPFLLSIFSPSIGKPVYVYTVIVWWAALYLRHHFVLDLVSGAFYAGVAYYFLGKENENCKKKTSTDGSDLEVGELDGNVWEGEEDQDGRRTSARCE